jgi:hypothetical protein
VLLSWGLAVLTIAGVLSFWIWQNEQQQEAREAQLQLEQDRAMCAMIGVFLRGPTPPPGPAGARARDVIAAMTHYQSVLHCQELETDPGPARDRDHK